MTLTVSLLFYFQNKRRQLTRETLRCGTMKYSRHLPSQLQPLADGVFYNTRKTYLSIFINTVVITEATEMLNAKFRTQT